MKDLITHTFIILDEAGLTIQKGSHGKPLQFKTKEDANLWAANNLELWQIIEMHFRHPWIQHKANDHLFG